jgi:homoserine dehydrogenase
MYCYLFIFHPYQTYYTHASNDINILFGTNMKHRSTSVTERPIFLLGFGGVGRALTRQIISTRALHKERNALHLKVIGIADSAGYYRDAVGMSDEVLAHLLDAKQTTGKLSVSQEPLSNLERRGAIPADAIVVDTSATNRTVPVLISAVENRCGVVLANKLPLAGDGQWFDTLAAGPARWETTVGAALPVISTLNTLLDSGDEVRLIEGSLSGTLGYIASQLEARVPFGAAVREAKQRGYTEPDPRQDLGGLDAARKALILARMLGYRLSMAQVQVESLYPAAMDALTVDQFMREVDSLDDALAARASQLTNGGRKLRYAAVIENGQCRVELVGALPESKLGSIRTSDSIVVFTTRYYNDNPLAVSGRGAGQEVTASGVLGDIIGLSREMK